jgi:predicted N-formylglutamate amidohydrolase
LAAKIGAPALLARFGRLLIDVNRNLDSDTLFRDVADGKPVTLNTNITPEDKQKRIDTFWKPYRDAYARLMAEYDPDLILSVHSYTPNYEGKHREVEIGVLYQKSKDLAEVVRC